MEEAIFGKEYLNELAAESPTRKCSERIPETLYDWKPHEKSMNLIGLLSFCWLLKIPK